MAGLYIHIPFCKKRCIYCDFYSTTQAELKADYVRALCLELEQRQDYLRGESLQTIYLGGGTPSQLSQAELECLFSTLYKYYKVEDGSEITMEANPDDLTSDYIHMLRQLPINRISMGVQTFSDEKLRLLNRRHTARQAREAVLLCRDYGFRNISIDLIYGLPGKKSTFEEDLEMALQLPIEHLSAYHLMYEEGTPLWNLWKKQQVSPIEEEESVRQFEHLIQRTQEAGFEHYEISNFCKPGYHSRHNSNYWENIPYLGCGASAHSYDRQSRQWNIANLPIYIKGIETKVPISEREILSLETRYNEFVMTGLRTRKGISLNRLETSFGKELLGYALKNALPYLKEGTLEEKEGYIKLTHRGIFISDGIMSDLMYVS